MLEHLLKTPDLIPGMNSFNSANDFPDIWINAIRLICVWLKGHDLGPWAESRYVVV